MRIGSGGARCNCVQICSVYTLLRFLLDALYFICQRVPGGPDCSLGKEKSDGAIAVRPACVGFDQHPRGSAWCGDGRRAQQRARHGRGGRLLTIRGI